MLIFWQNIGYSHSNTTSASVSLYLDVYSVTIANVSQNSISVPINIGLNKQTIKTLLDCGAGGMFIEPVKAFNVDGTKNKKGTIKSYVDLQF